MDSGPSVARRRLGRIRCLQKCIDSVQHSLPLPSALCYVVGEMTYRVARGTRIKVYNDPMSQSKKQSHCIADLTLNVADKITVKGEELCTSTGQWAQLLKVRKFISL